MRILFTLLSLLFTPVILFSQDSSQGLAYMHFGGHTDPFVRPQQVSFAERIQVSYGVSVGITRQLLDIYRLKGLSVAAQESAVETLLFQYKRLTPEGYELREEELSALGVDPGSQVADILNYDFFLSRKGNASPVLPVCDLQNRTWFGIASTAFRRIWRKLEDNKVPIERFQQQLIGEIDQFVSFRGLLQEYIPDRQEGQSLLYLLDSGHFEEVAQKIADRLAKAEPRDAAVFFLAGLAAEMNQSEADAFEYYQRAVKLDRKNPRYASTLGRNLIRAGRLDEAIVQFHTALKLTSAPRANKQDLALHLNDLGEAYLRKGQPDRALPLIEKAMQANLREPEMDHRLLLTNLNNISLAYKAKGDYQMALKYQEEELALKLETMGMNHPNTAVGYNNLGLIYLAQQDFDRALEHFQQALEIISSVYGANHHFAASGFHQIGALFLKQGDLSSALDHFQQAQNILAGIYGERHALLANVYRHLGVVERELGNQEPALQYFGIALEINKTAYGDQHQSVAYGYNNLGDIYLDKRDYDAAIGYFRAGLDIFQARFDQQHPNVLDSYSRLGAAYAAKEDWPATLQLYQKSEAIAQSIYGHQHPKMAPIYNHLGEAFLQMSDYDKAFEFLTKALQIHLVYKGETDPDVAMIYGNIGDVFLRKKDAGLAIEYITKALAIDQSRSKTDPGILALRFNDLGAAYQSKGAFTKAVDLYHQALEIVLEAFGEQDAQVAMIYHNLGEAYLTQDPGRSLEYFGRAAEVDQAAGKTSARVIASRYWDIGRAHQALGAHTEAIHFYEKALSLDSAIQSRQEYSDLGVAYVQTQQTERASRFFAEYTERFPDHPLAYRNWMLYYTATGKLAKAAKNFEKAVSAGFSDLSWVRSEQILEPLKHHRKYQQLVRIMENAARP